MTKEQVTTCLEAVSEVTNAWVTLEGKYTHLSIDCDTNLFISPRTCQFYFDTDNELLFIRHTLGPAKELEEGGSITRGYVAVPHNGKSYLLKLEDGGCNDRTIGKFHEALSFEMINGFY